MKVKPAFIIAFAVIAVSMVVTLLSFANSISHHMTIAQAKLKPGESVQIPGSIVKESIVFDPIKGGLTFDIVDKADPKQRLTVVYPEPKPENFDTATSVEAIGTYKDGVFRADRLLVKCPSKYSDEKLAPEKKV